MGVHNNFVSSCEMGDRALNFIEVRAWCGALGISWVEFTRELDEMLGSGVEKPFEQPSDE